MFENRQRTELHELGEFKLIDQLTSSFTNQQASTIKGIGDDAAVIDKGDSYSVISSDLLIEGIHFDLSFMPLKHLGYKAIAVNISDICAMNAKPEQVLVSIAVSNRFSLEAMEELYSGIQAACTHYNVDLVGGDTSGAPKGLFISVTAIGTVGKDKIVYRKGAQANELLCVSGDLGGAYTGLRLLEREKKIFLEHPGSQPDLEPYEYIVGRQLKPEARLDIIQSLEKAGITPTSMIDISDGLSSEILHLCKASDVGMHVYEEKLPIDHLTHESALELGLEPTMCAMNGGEDFELLFTIKQTDFEKLREVKGVTVIGHCVSSSEGNMLISAQGNTYPIVAQGWQAFEN